MKEYGVTYLGQHWFWYWLGKKLWPEPMLTCRQYSFGTNFSQLGMDWIDFLSWKFICECCLQSDGHFVQATVKLGGLEILPRTSYKPHDAHGSLGNRRWVIQSTDNSIKNYEWTPTADCSQRNKMYWIGCCILCDVYSWVNIVMN